MGALIRVCTRSPVCHVAIADDEVVLDPRLDGDLFRPLLPYVLHAPGLYALVRVRAPGPLALARHTPQGPRRLIPSLLCHLTRGRWPCRDCVAVVKAHLRAAGLSVPRHITTPAGLYRWATNHDHAATHPFH